MVSKKVKDKNSVALPTMSSSWNEIKTKYHKVEGQHTVSFTYSWFWYMYFLDTSWGSQTVQHLYIPCIICHHITGCDIILSQVLLPSDFAHHYNQKRTTSWNKNKIWCKQGSQGYHAISVHAELFNSYSLTQSDTTVWNATGDKNIFVLHLD